MTSVITFSCLIHHTGTEVYVNYLLSDVDGKESSSIMQSSYFSVLRKQQWSFTSLKINIGVPSQELYSKD